MRSAPSRCRRGSHTGAARSRGWPGRSASSVSKRPLLVTDAGVVKAGLAALALEQLSDAVVFADVPANPDIAAIDRGAALYREHGCDGLVAIGGGSPMDTAKSIGVVIVHGGSIASYEWGKDPIDKRIPPLVAIPTTAGTGSEVTLWAVVTDHARHIKFNVGGTPLIAAHVALIDPELMLGLPPAITAATGMDALAHAIECYTCDYHQPFNDAVALQAIELVATWLSARRRRRSGHRGTHWHGARGDARRAVLRHGERRRGARHEPVGGRRARLLARRADGAPARPRLCVQCHCASRALCARRLRAWPSTSPGSVRSTRRWPGSRRSPD